MRTYKKKHLPKGVQVWKGKVWIRIFPNNQRVQKCVGPLNRPGILDEAIALVTKYRDEIRLGKFGREEKQDRLTMDKAIDLYYELHGSKKKSAKSFRYHLKVIKQFFQGRYVDSMTYIDIQDYRRDREQRVKPISVNKEQSVITHLFNKLKEWRRLKIISNFKLPDENPGPLVKKANERDTVRKRVLTPEELNYFLKFCTSNARIICFAAVQTLLRKKDLRLLTKRNINPSIHRLEGIQAKTSKPYSVPINTQLEEIINQSRGAHLFDFTNFRKEFEKAVRLSKIKDFQFRDLRRTGARMLLKEGEDLATVSKYLGHTTLAMTERYVACAAEDVQRAGDVLGRMFKWDGEMAAAENAAQVSG